MPTSRKRRDVWDEDDDNEEEEVVTKKAKKVKKAKKSAATVSDSEANVTKDSEGNHYWEVSHLNLCCFFVVDSITETFNS